MLVTNKDLLVPARRKTYAVGAFNINNLETVLAVSDAADEEQSPAIVSVTPSAIKYGGLPYLAKIVKTAAESSLVPMSLHLDHGEDFDTVSKCITAGFTSVMIDGSHMKFEENIALTKRMVDLAHPKKVSVEAELGRLAGVEEKPLKRKRQFLPTPIALKSSSKARMWTLLQSPWAPLMELTSLRLSPNSILKDWR